MITEHITFAAVTPDQLTDQRQEVIVQHRNTRDAAYRAIAHCTILGLCCFGASAASLSTEWLLDQVDKYNAEVNAHNAVIDAARKRATDYSRTGKFPEGDTLRIQHTDPVHKAEQEAAKEALLAEANKGDEYWDSQRRHPADNIREDANRYTGLVRFAYGYDKAEDAGSVSELARVVEYLVGEFQSVTFASIEGIVERIGECGGKSGILKKARGNGSNDNNKLLPHEEAAIFEAYRKKLAAAAASVPSQATANFNFPDNAEGDLVLVLGRKDAASTAILTPLSIDDSLLKNFTAAFNKAIQIKMAPEVEFLSRLLSFMQMIPAGKQSRHTVDGTLSGLKAKERRVVVAYLDAKAQLNFLLTAQYSDANPLLKATLRNTVKFNFFGPAQFIAGDDLKDFNDLLNDDINRFLVAVSSGMPDGTFTLSLNHSIKKDGSGNPYVASAAFLPLANELVKPIDADQRNTDNTMTLTYTNAKAFYDAELAAWKTKQRGGNAKLTFGNAGIEYGYSGKHTYHIPADNVTGSTNQLHFRGVDLHKAFRCLLELPCQAFSLEVDVDGLLKITCDDQYATYELYIPAASNDNYLSNRFKRARV
jgi:hypothetical protein